MQTTCGARLGWRRTSVFRALPNCSQQLWMAASAVLVQKSPRSQNPVRCADCLSCLKELSTCRRTLSVYPHYSFFSVQACQHGHYVVIKTCQMHDARFHYRVVSTKQSIVLKRIVDIDRYVICRRDRQYFFLSISSSTTDTSITSFKLTTAADQSLIRNLTHINNTT